MRIVWTDDAVANLEAIVIYVSAFNPVAAEALGVRLIAVAASLASFPDRGRDVGDGRRERTTVWPYILRYRVVGDCVVILCFRHGARTRRQEMTGTNESEQKARRDYDTWKQVKIERGMA